MSNPMDQSHPMDAIKHKPSDWAGLVQSVLLEAWPSCPIGDISRWLLAQIQQESGGDPKALSPVGAQGLLQLMPGTAADMHVSNVFDPGANLDGGIRYLRMQFERLAEIVGSHNRLFWALASYNAGRGFINAALQLARTVDLDASVIPAVAEAGMTFYRGLDPVWWIWDDARWYLADPRCLVTGLRPDWKQAIGYVEAIRRTYSIGPT